MTISNKTKVNTTIQATEKDLTCIKSISPCHAVTFTKWANFTTHYFYYSFHRITTVSCDLFSTKHGVNIAFKCSVVFGLCNDPAEEGQNHYNIAVPSATVTCEKFPIPKSCQLKFYKKASPLLILYRWKNKAKMITVKQVTNLAAGNNECLLK